MKVTLVGNEHIQQVLRTEEDKHSRKICTKFLTYTGPGSVLLRASVLPFPIREWVVKHCPLSHEEMSMPIKQVADLRGIPLSAANNLVLETFIRSHHLTDTQFMKQLC